MDFSDLTDTEKRALVEEARKLWSDEVADLLAEDLGMKAKAETRH